MMGPNFWERRQKERWGWLFRWWRLPISGSFGGDGGRFWLGFDMSFGMRRRRRREMKKMNVENEVRDGRMNIVYAPFFLLLLYRYLKYKFDNVTLLL